jgi:hypothetical protein
MGSIRVGWWNLQNLFDADDDPISADLEFTVVKGWTPEVYAAKLTNLAGAIRELHAGAGPELLGVCEVEGDEVFQALLDEIGDPHLKLVADPAGTSDLRGIVVFEVLESNERLVVIATHTGHRAPRVAGAPSRCESRWPRTSRDRPDQRDQGLRSQDQDGTRDHLPVTAVLNY